MNFVHPNYDGSSGPGSNPRSGHCVVSRENDQGPRSGFSRGGLMRTREREPTRGPGACSPGKISEMARNGSKTVNSEVNL